MADVHDQHERAMRVFLVARYGASEQGLMALDYEGLCHLRHLFTEAERPLAVETAWIDRWVEEYEGIEHRVNLLEQKAAIHGSKVGLKGYGHKV